MCGVSSHRYEKRNKASSGTRRENTATENQTKIARAAEVRTKTLDTRIVPIKTEWIGKLRTDKKITVSRVTWIRIAQQNGTELVTWCSAFHEYKAQQMKKPTSGLRDILVRLPWLMHTYRGLYRWTSNTCVCMPRFYWHKS